MGGEKIQAARGIAKGVANHLLQKKRRKEREKRFLNALLKEIQYNKSLVQKELRGKASIKDPKFFTEEWYSAPPRTISFDKTEKKGILDVLPTPLYKDIIETYYYLNYYSKRPARSPRLLFKPTATERKWHLEALEELFRRLNSINTRLRKYLRTK